MATKTNTFDSALSNVVRCNLRKYSIISRPDIRQTF